MQLLLADALGDSLRLGTGVQVDDTPLLLGVSADLTLGGGRERVPALDPGLQLVGLSVGTFIVGNAVLGSRSFVIPLLAVVTKVEIPGVGEVTEHPATWSADSRRAATLAVPRAGRCSPASWSADSFRATPLAVP